MAEAKFQKDLSPFCFSSDKNYFLEVCTLAFTPQRHRKNVSYKPLKINRGGFGIGKKKWANFEFASRVPFLVLQRFVR